MTEFREDLEYWTDRLIATNADLAPLRAKLDERLETITTDDLRFLDICLSRMSAEIHWLDRTVNHYPKPTKKFWQFWKK